MIIFYEKCNSCGQKHPSVYKNTQCINCRSKNIPNFDELVLKSRGVFKYGKRDRNTKSERPKPEL